MTSHSAPFIDARWRRRDIDDDVIDTGSLKSRQFSPILVRRGDPIALTVRVRGDPTPVVTWYVGRKPVTVIRSGNASLDGPFRVEWDHESGRHTLLVSGAATETLEEGVWVVAGNELGQDCTAIKVTTYRGKASIYFFSFIIYFIFIEIRKYRIREQVQMKMSAKNLNVTRDERLYVMNKTIVTRR